MSTGPRIALIAMLCLPPSVLAQDAKPGHDDDHREGQEHREHGTHVHGVAWLDVAFDDRQLELALKGTGADLAGLEGEPVDAADVAKVESARRTLGDAGALFGFEPAGACLIDGMPVVEPPPSALVAPGAEHDHDHDHDHDDEHEHGDWAATYAFTCTTPPTALTLSLFDRYPELSEVRAQILNSTSQTAAEATPAQRRIVLPGGR